MNKHTYMRQACILTLVHDPASVPPAAFVRYLPALQAVHTDAPLAENCPLAHCIHPRLSAHTHAHGLVPLTLDRIRPLTLVHDAASVPPDASVRYLPALQAVHTDAPLAENHPLAHCIYVHTHTRMQACHHHTIVHP